MPRLGEILTSKGLLTTDQLRSGLEACRRQGGRLGTWLVRLGFITEAQLLEALSEQTRCPPARALELATAPSEVRTLLPEEFSRRHLVVPFNRHGKFLDIATPTPNDAKLIEEISSLTGLVVRPHVATEAALNAALAIPAVRPRSAEAPAPGVPRSRHWQWTRFWRVAGTPQEAFQALASSPPPAGRHAAATFPHLAPLAAGAASSRRHKPESLEDLASTLADASEREEVANTLLEFFAPQAARVALFALHQGKVTGWALGGADHEARQRFMDLTLALDRPSVFLNLSAGAELHCGPVPGGDGNQPLLQALGSPAPQGAVIVPLVVRGKAAGFLWLDNGPEGITGISVPLVRQAAALAGLALEVLVLRSKIRTQPRLTAGRGRSRVALPKDGGRDDQS
jgi:hypothetical protein